MNQRHVWKKNSVLVLLFLILFTLVATGRSSPNALANYGLQSSMNEQVDLISFALDQASLKGLTDEPKEISVFQGNINDLALPGDEYYDHETVWLVWLKGKIIPTWPTMYSRPNPASNLYIFIDAKTGQAFQFLASDFPIEELSQKSWISVSKNDVGKYSIPKFAYDEAEGGLGPTPTPVKP